MASTLHIPFRCPNCGDNSRQFETLHDLRSHLEKEHSYTSSRYRHQPVTSSPAVGLRSRTGRHSPLTEMFHSDAQRLEESLRKRKEEELNNKRRRSEMSNLHLSKDSSGNAGFQEKIQNIPQHYSFRDYGHSSRLQKYYTPSKYLRDRQNIEGMQTNKAFPDEPYMRDKTKDEPISGLFTDIQNKEGINRSSHFAETDLSSQMSPSITATSNPSEKHIKDTLSALSHEVLVERASQFATADSLYTAQELLSSVEQAAEIKIAQQKKVIEILAEKLKEKENRLAGVMGQIELLSHHQMDSFEKVSILKRQSDLKAQLLQKELDQKQKDFDNLNQKLFEIQQSLVKGDSSMQKSGKIENSSILNVNLSTDSPESSASMNLDPDFEKPTSFTEKMSLGRSASKTKEIKRVQNKAHQLERDRQNLLIEMQNLLQSAATDNEKLQSELASQSQELSQLSYDLEQSKHEQAALLGETHALYRQADVSLAQLKIMLKDKEGELKNVSKSLEQAKAAQSKLARERDEYVRLCQERETKYKEMMSSNSQQIQSMKKTLDLSVHDKKQLQGKLKDLKRELDAKNGKDAILSDNVAHLKSALEEKVKSQAKLKEELHKREDKLKKAKREMERMTRFLEDTAEKELEARSKLEDFISGLIDRAGRAETELQKLKEESYRLHQKSKQSSKKHRRDSNQLDLSALPGASSLVAQTSLEYDTESLSSSNIPSTYQYDQKHYHSTPRAPTSQQLAPTPLPRKLSPRNFGAPHVTNKSMNISEVDSDVHHISGDGNSKPLLPDSLSSLACEDAISKHETSAPSHGILQQNTADRQQNEEEKHLISSSAKLTEPPKSEVSDLPVCPACSQTMHASQRLACPENLTDSSLLFCPSHHSPSLNVLQSLTSVSPESKSLHVVPHSICIVTNSMAQSASLAPLQSQPFAGYTKMSSPVMYPVLLTNVYTTGPVNQTSLLPNHKVITDTEVADKSLFAPSTIPEFAPMYYNSTPWFYNFTSANPYNLYTDWSKQLARSLPESLLKEEESDNSLYLSYLNSKEISLFKNTPQVERMFANVFNDSHNLHGFETPPLTEESRRTPKERLQPKHIYSDAEFRQRLSMDENGIMWESSHDSRTHHNDDTDIDEDISDFIYDAEPTHKSDSSQYFNVKESPNKQSKYSPQFEEMSSVGKKMAKVLNADNAKTYKSSARDDNKHFSSNYHPRSSNDYSSEESMEESPLQKARMVQKRLEYFTNSKPRDFLVSKQSEGFDVSHMDSDLSTSSYQSLYKPNNHVNSTVQKTVAENTIKQEELQSLPTKTEINHPEAVIVQQKYPDVQQKYPDLHQKYPDIVEKDYVNEAMEKETVVSKPSLFAVQEISDNKSNLQTLASLKQSIQNQTPEVNQHSTVQNQPAAKYFDSIQHQVPDQHHLLEPHSPSQLVDQIKDHPLTSRGGDHMHSSEKFGAPQHLPKSTLLEALEPTPMPVKEELTHHTEVLQGQNNPHPNSAVNASNAENDDEDVSETSSDEDYTQADLGPTSISARKESIDASTDTDLEKLARPGYVQKGLVVRKNIPTVKHIRKNKRRKPLMKRMQSGDSSEADDLDDMQRERRHFIRRMRVALFKIFLFLDTATLVKMSCVCREWCKVSRHPALWKIVKLENKAISSSFLNTLSQWCTQTESLTLKGLTGRPINGAESAEEYSNSIRGSLEAGLERFLSSCQNTITQVCIDQCDNILTDKCLWLVSGYCRLLTKLTYQSSVDCVTPQLMWALGGGCPGVTSLFIQPKPPFKANGMNNRCLLLIAQFYKDIQEIGLGGKEFDTAGLVALVKSCQRLQVVHLEYCMPMTSDLATSLCKVGLKNIQTLSILGTTVEAKALQTFQGNSRQLKKILVQMKLEDCVGGLNKKKDKETYKKMVKALEGLKTKAGIGNILTLEAGPAE